MTRTAGPGGLLNPAGRLAGSWAGLTALLALALVAVLAVSGAAMSVYYSPAPGTAWDSVDYAQYRLPFGDVVRGVHVYAANLLLGVLLVHLAGIFVAGAYKRPGQRAWLSLVAIVALLPAFFVTGDLLPWTQSGYWSTQVRLSVLATVPVVGDLAAEVLRGGSHIGVVTLTRFYVLHILFLPWALLVVLAVHAWLVGRDTAALPEGDPARDPRLALLDLANRWLLVALLTGAALALAAWRVPAPLGEPADPTDTSYVPRPEWWALVLNQLVTIFSGRWAFVGSTLIPGVLLGLLLAVPFLDRASGRHPRQRGTVMLVAAVLLLAMLTLSALGYASHYLAPPPESHVGRPR